jgi:hypothetical protein
MTSVLFDLRDPGGAEVGVSQDHHVRRDGTRQRSRFFRLDRTGWLGSLGKGPS